MNTNSRAKRILCYGDSNTWGWVPREMGKKRFNLEERWPGILQRKLGQDYEIIEEGLAARTTAFDDPRPDFPERNGLKSLYGLLESHLPIDLFVVMLGTTDTKEMLNKKATEIAEGMEMIVQFVRNFKDLEAMNPPKILIVVPPIIEDQTEFASKLFKGGTDKARDLIHLYKKIAEKEKCLYLDPTSIVLVDSVEGVHMNKDGHSKLADLIYDKVVQASLF